MRTRMGGAGKRTAGRMELRITETATEDRQSGHVELVGNPQIRGTSGPRHGTAEGRLGALLPPGGAELL